MRFRATVQMFSCRVYPSIFLLQSLAAIYNDLCWRSVPADSFLHDVQRTSKAETAEIVILISCHVLSGSLAPPADLRGGQQLS